MWAGFFCEFTVVYFRLQSTLWAHATLKDAYAKGYYSGTIPEAELQFQEVYLVYPTYIASVNS